MSRLDRAWPIWPAAGLLACFGYTVMPSAHSAAALSAATGLVSVVLTLVGVRRNRSSRPLGWYLFAGGLAAWVGGDLTYAIYSLVLHTQPFPSLTDVLYLSAYPLLFTSLFALTRGGLRRDLPALLDTAVIATGLGLIYWIFVIGPIAVEPGVPLLTRLVTVAYPTAGVLLFAVLVPLVARSGRRTPSLWLLSVGSAATLSGNVIYSLLPDSGAYVAKLAFGVFLFAYACFAGAALHPSANTLGDDVEGAELVGRRRLALLGASTLVVPAVLLTEGLRRPDRVDWAAIAAGSVLLFGLVLARLSGFVTKVQVQAGQLKDLAMRDELTGLPNRRLFENRLREALRDGSAQVAILDLDGFKEINDRFGHAVGDRLLVAVAGRLADALRGDDLVARMGGDEFAVLVAGRPDTVMPAIVERLGASLRRSIEVDGHELLVSASVGSTDSVGTTDLYEVLRRADVAMYAAKEVSEGCHRRFSPDLDRAAGEQARIGAELRAALDTGQFRLVYQPIVSLPDGRIVSVEALVRWDHPQRGFISPADFIPIAEQNGLIVELGAWILRTACAQVVVWRDTLGADAPQRMSVNVSARQLAEPGFPELVTSVLAWTGLGAHHLVAEVTETAVFGGGQAVRAVKALHELGVRIALDDFGTGHSSLGLLQSVPVDILKVDKSFVDNITMAGRHAVIATALIQVSNGLGLSAVAEGVETAEQAAELHRMGYQLAQGYHFGRPVADPFAALAGKSEP